MTTSTPDDLIYLDHNATTPVAPEVWFWWDAPTLGLEWFADFQDRQAQYAGERYRPELQVDLPIGQDLRGLGFSQTLIDV